MMRSKTVLALIVFAQIIGTRVGAEQARSIVGSWSVEISFPDGEHRSFRFEAQGAGHGSFLLLDPRLKVWGPAAPSDAKWTQDAENSVMLSGSVEFPLGNVGRDAGTLVLKGKLETGDSISGQAMFFRAENDVTAAEAKPAKSGSFKATRIAG